MDKQETKALCVTKEVWKKLMEIKLEHGFSSVSAVILAILRNSNYNKNE